MHDVVGGNRVGAGAAARTVMHVKCARRTPVCVGHIVAVPVVDALAVVDALPPVMVLVVHVQRREAAMMPVVVVARDVVTLAVQRRVVVTKIEVVVPRCHKQMQQQRVTANPEVRSIVVPGTQIDRTAEIHRREQESAARQRVVPVAGYVDAAARCPDVAGTDPHPVLPVRMPVTGAPAIAADVHRQLPVTGNPEVVIGRRRTGGTCLQTLGRCLGVVELRNGGRTPETGNPLIARLGCLPVTRYPLPVRRHPPPYATDPYVTVQVAVPEPVSGNPRHVLAFGFPVGRHLVNRVRRRLGRDHARFRVGTRLLRIRLVYRPSRQDVHVLLSVGSPLGRGRLRSHQLQFLANAHLADHQQENDRPPPIAVANHVTVPPQGPHKPISVSHACRHL